MRLGMRAEITFIIGDVSRASRIVRASRLPSGSGAVGIFLTNLVRCACATLEVARTDHVTLQDLPGASNSHPVSSHDRLTKVGLTVCGSIIAVRITPAP